MLFRSPFLLLFVCGALFSAPQDPAAQAPGGGADNTGLLRSVNISLEPVAPGDLIAVYVASYPDISRTYRITRDGTISIPVFDHGVAVAGLTPPEVEKVIARSLREAKLLVDPVVSVAVEEYRSRPVQISGAVKHPMTIQALGETHLLDALAKCDGLSPEAGDDIVVLQPQDASVAAGGTGSELHISAKRLFDGSDPQLNISLHGGEQIRVAPAAGSTWSATSKRPEHFRSPMRMVSPS